jgi:hypothetical protein
MYPAGRRGPADGGGQAAPDPGLRRRRGGVSAGFEPEVGYLVLLVADAQREVMQGAAKDGVGAVVELLKQWYVLILPDEHRWCEGEVIGQLRRWPAGGGGVVSSGRVLQHSVS